MLICVCRFRPTPYTALVPGLSGHLQTFFNEFLRPPPPMQFEREHIELEDGGTLALDYYPSSLFDDSTPTMLVYTRFMMAIGVLTRIYP